MKTIIQRPIITEKAMDATKRNDYSFMVATTASKYQIKEAVESLFSVSVMAVRTISISGKAKRVGKMRRMVQSASYKKAIVRLKKGQTIDLVSVAPQTQE